MRTQTDNLVTLIKNTAQGRSVTVGLVKCYPRGIHRRIWEWNQEYCTIMNTRLEHKYSQSASQSWSSGGKVLSLNRQTDFLFS